MNQKRLTFGERLKRAKKLFDYSIVLIFPGVILVGIGAGAMIEKGGVKGLAGIAGLVSVVLGAVCLVLVFHFESLALKLRFGRR